MEKGEYQTEDYQINNAEVASIYQSVWQFTFLPEKIHLGQKTLGWRILWCYNWYLLFETLPTAYCQLPITNCKLILSSDVDRSGNLKPVFSNNQDLVYGVLQQL